MLSLKKALLFSGLWVAVSLLFNIWVYYARGLESALNFLAGYLLEKTLSIDNLFVFLLIFKTFNIEKRWRSKVLFWGIWGAIILRALFIVLGVALISHFNWLLYIFGLFLIISAIKLLQQKETKTDPADNWLVQAFKKLVPIAEENPRGKFFIIQKGKLYATTLFLALISVEASDIVFALDSIPAIFGITLDPFIIYTSNIFAILGLRSLYFVLENLIELFHYLHYGLALILFLIGSEMVLKDIIHIPNYLTLVLIIITLVISITLSVLKNGSRRI